MDQMNIFYEIGLSNDPVYFQLTKLKVNEIISIDGLEVTKTEIGFYEISSDDIHECFSDIMKCYEKIESLNCPVSGAFI
ncbi:hypothetical protein HUN92_13770 [Bacillus firmus]|uniref:hypothetical protein n=1 Tax=Cytobacillus firmus TaxID=1399 RepID=UPI00157FD5E8|nr:hypothetical protein [Cytobacillus firmus]NUH84788.1 hypothetical protein [Cytobacillus firmus]